MCACMCGWVWVTVCVCVSVCVPMFCCLYLCAYFYWIVSDQILYSFHRKWLSSCHLISNPSYFTQLCAGTSCWLWQEEQHRQPRRHQNKTKVAQVQVLSWRLRGCLRQIQPPEDPQPYPHRRKTLRVQRLRKSLHPEIRTDCTQSETLRTKTVQVRRVWLCLPILQHAQTTHAQTHRWEAVQV